MLPQGPFSKILIIRLSAVGDVVRTLPALSMLRANYPSAHISWIVEEKSSDIIQDHPELDELIIFPRKKWKAALSHPGSLIAALKETVGIAVNLRRQKFDLVLDFHGVLKSGMISRITGSPARVGFNRGASKECNHLFNRYHIEVDDGSTSRYEKNSSLVRPFLHSLPESRPTIAIGQRDRERVEVILKEHFTEYDSLVTINPAASREYKQWPVEYFGQLIDKLYHSGKYRIAMVVGPGEEGLAVSAQANIKTHRCPVLKPVGLKELAETLRLSQMLICGDTGPMHIAAVMNTPTVAIFGPTDPVVNGPFGKGHHLITKQVHCSPCREFNCQSLECLRTISPEEVFQAVEETMSGKVG